MPRENLIIGRRLKELCPPGLQSEPQLFGLLREYLTNSKPAGAKQNLSYLRNGSTEYDEPAILTTKLESALRAGELGDGLKTVYIAGLIQAGESITDDEMNFVKSRSQRLDFGSFTWGR